MVCLVKKKMKEKKKKRKNINENWDDFVDCLVGKKDNYDINIQN